MPTTYSVSDIFRVFHISKNLKQASNLLIYSVGGQTRKKELFCGTCTCKDIKFNDIAIQQHTPSDIFTSTLHTTTLHLQKC